MFYDLNCVSSSKPNVYTLGSSWLKVCRLLLSLSLWALSRAARPPKRDVSAGFVSVNRMDFDIIIGDGGTFGAGTDIS